MSYTLIHNVEDVRKKVREVLRAGADVVTVATDPLANVRSLEKVSNIKVVIQGGKVLKDIR